MARIRYKVRDTATGKEAYTLDPLTFTGKGGRVFTQNRVRNLGRQLAIQRAQKIVCEQMGIPLGQQWRAENYTEYRRLMDGMVDMRASHPIPANLVIVPVELTRNWTTRELPAVRSI